LGWLLLWFVGVWCVWCVIGIVVCCVCEMCWVNG
jgi:hypothetical protein